jgi:hypothetical protein
MISEAQMIRRVLQMMDRLATLIELHIEYTEKRIQALDT